MADEYLCPITHEVMRDPVIAEGMLKFNWIKGISQVCHTPYLPVC